MDVFEEMCKITGHKQVEQLAIGWFESDELKNLPGYVEKWNQSHHGKYKIRRSFISPKHCETINRDVPFTTMYGFYVRLDTPDDIENNKTFNVAKNLWAVLFTVEEFQSKYNISSPIVMGTFMDNASLFK